MKKKTLPPWLQKKDADDPQEKPKPVPAQKRRKPTKGKKR